MNSLATKTCGYEFGRALSPILECTGPSLHLSEACSQSCIPDIVPSRESCRSLGVRSKNARQTSSHTNSSELEPGFGHRRREVFAGNNTSPIRDLISNIRKLENRIKFWKSSVGRKYLSTSSRGRIKISSPSVSSEALSAYSTKFKLVPLEVASEMSRTSLNAQVGLPGHQAGSSRSSNSHYLNRISVGFSCSELSNIVLQEPRRQL